MNQKRKPRTKTPQIKKIAAQCLYLRATLVRLAGRAEKLETLIRRAGV